MDITKTIKDKGFSVSKVAEVMGINRVSLSTMINNNPTYKTMKQVADVIGANVSEFFEDEIKKPKGDFAAYVRCNGIHWTADSLDEFNKVVEEVRTIAK